MVRDDPVVGMPRIDMLDQAPEALEATVAVVTRRCVDVWTDVDFSWLERFHRA